MCRSVCCDRGLLIGTTCSCDIEFFGQDCSLRLMDDHEVAYIIYIGIFGFIFIIMLIISIQDFKESLKMNKIPSYYRGVKYIYQLLSSPKNYILTLSVIFCFMRILWLIFNPLNLYDHDERVYERLLSECVYSILFIIYGVLLMVWYTMYDEISFNIVPPESKTNRVWIFKYYKDVMKVRLAMVLFIQIVVSTINGLRVNKEYSELLYILYALLLVNFAVFIIEFFIYGRQLRLCIQIQMDNADKDFKVRQEEIKKYETKRINRLTLTVREDELTPHSSSQIHSGRSAPSPRVPDTIKIELVNQVQEQKDIRTQFQKIKFRPSRESFGKSFSVKRAESMKTYRQESETQIEGKKIEKNYTIPEEDLLDTSVVVEEPKQVHKITTSCLLDEENDLQIKWEQFNKDIVLKQQEEVVNSIRETRTKLKQSSRRQASKLTSINEQKSAIQAQRIQDEAMEMLENKRDHLVNDRNVLRKVQLLVQLGVFLEVCFGILSVVILATDILHTPEGINSHYIGTLIYLYISSMLQFLSLLLVVLIFRDINSSDKLALIWIAKVGNKKNNINQNYAFVIPQELKDEDSSKQKFESRINLNAFY